MRGGLRGGEGRRQVKDHTDAGRGGVGRVTVWEIWAVLADDTCVTLGCKDEIWKRRKDIFFHSFNLSTLHILLIGHTNSYIYLYTCYNIIVIIPVYLEA